MVVSGIGTPTGTLMVGSLIGVLHLIGGTSASGTDTDRLEAMSCFIKPNLDELAQDNSISVIIKQTFYIVIKTLLHYHQYFVTWSSRFSYNFDNTLLHYHEDFVVHSITIIKFVLHTFSDKYL